MEGFLRGTTGIGMDNRSGLPPGIARIAEALCTISAAERRRRTKESEGPFEMLSPAGRDNDELKAEFCATFRFVISVKFPVDQHER